MTGLSVEEEKPSTDVMAGLSVEEENYARFSLLLTGVAPRAVRTLFDREFAPAKLTKSIRKEFKKIGDLFYQRHINEAQRKILIGGQLDSKQFDVTLMICLIRNLTNVPPPKSGYDVLPQPSDTCEGADLARIKYYRNFLAHLDDNKIDSSYFATVWGEISGAISRLGTPSLQLECDKLEHAPLHPSTVEILKEARKTKIELDTAKEDIEDLKMEMRQVKEDDEVMNEQLRLEFPEIEPLSKGKEYENRMKDFVDTEVGRSTAFAIENHQFVIVTGPPGCGKMMNIFHAALKTYSLSDISLCDIDFISNMYKKGDTWDYFDKTSNDYDNTSIFILEHIFGENIFNVKNFQIWHENISKLKIALRRKDFKVVITCRMDIYESFVKDRLVIPVYHCPVEYKNYDVITICQAYSNSNDVEIRLPKEPIYLACLPALYACRFREKIGEIIQNSCSLNEFIANEVERLTNDSIWHNKAILLLCLMNNHIDNTIFRLTTHTHDQLLEKICWDVQNRMSVIKDKIERSLLSLTETYINKTKTVYSFKQTWLFDYFVAYLCNQHVDLVLDYSSNAFIRDRVCLPKERDTRRQVVINSDALEKYKDRLIKDLDRGCIWDVLGIFQRNGLSIDPILIDWYRGQSSTTMVDNASNDNCFHVAVFYGILELVKSLITFGKSQINSLNAEYKTPLYFACALGFIEIAQVLLKNDATQPIKYDKISPLYIACANENVDIVQMLIQNNKDDISICHTSSLSVACEHGNLEIVKLLVECNPLVTESRAVVTPLHIASFHGHTEIVELLLKHNAPANTQNPNWFSPLFYASRNGHKGIVQILLKHYAAVNNFYDDYHSPLYSASKNGHSDIVEILLRQNAISNTYKDSISTACQKGHEKVVEVFFEFVPETKSRNMFLLHQACKNCSTDNVEGIVNLLLSEKIEMNKLDNDGNAPIHYALMDNNLELCELLIQNGASIDISDVYGRTPLFKAATNGQKDFVKLLLSHNADVNKADNGKQTPLNAICGKSLKRLEFNGIKCNSQDISNCCEIVELLLQRKADVDICNEDGNSPLTSCCNEDNLLYIQLFLKYGASINTLDNNGRFPLHAACVQKNLPIVSVLIEHEADINLRCTDGTTALLGVLKTCATNSDLQKFLNEFKIVDLLLKHDVDVNLVKNDKIGPLHIVCINNLTSLAQLLLERGPILPLKTGDGSTPLHLACKKMNINMVCLLMKHINHSSEAEDTLYHRNEFSPEEHYSIINAVDNEGQTPLHISCRVGNAGIVEILLKNGSSIDIQDKKECSSLFKACQYNHVQVIRLLLQFGASINLRGPDNKTPIDIAKSNKKENIVKLLSQSGSSVTE